MPDDPVVRFSRKCVAVSFLAGMSGSVVAMAFLYLFNTITSVVGYRAVILGAGLVPTVAAGAIIACLVIYAMLELSLRQAMRVAAVPVLSILILAAIIATPTGYLAFKQRRARQHKDRSLDKVRRLTSELGTYQRRTGRSAPLLQSLVEQNILGPEDLICPAAPAKKVGYFYRRARLDSRNEQSRRILLCDFRDNHGDGRSVALTNGKVIWYKEREFQSLLQEDQNRDFAELLRAAEGS
jgi:hypothetical protein